MNSKSYSYQEFKKFEEKVREEISKSEGWMFYEWKEDYYKATVNLNLLLPVVQHYIREHGEETTYYCLEEFLLKIIRNQRSNCKLKVLIKDSKTKLIEKTVDDIINDLISICERNAAMVFYRIA